MRDVLRQLAELELSNVPVLSIYLDMRPQATGQNPAVRSGRIVLKDRLREIEKTLGPRGPALESFQADAARIERYLDEEAPSESQGLAIFASHGRDLFEIVQSGVAFENQVTLGHDPELFQLVRLLDEQETAVVAVVDSNTARLFVTRTGALEEVGGPDDESVHYRKRSTGGWSQARYQRHIDKHRADFAREAAGEIERLVEREDAARVILAGDEVAMTPLRAALSPAVAALVPGEPIRLHIRAPRDEVASEVEPLLARAEAEEACSIGDQILHAVQAGGLGVAGLDAIQRALKNGQVDTLALDPAAPLDRETRSALVRQATLTGAVVEIVEGHTGLAELGGVGALLRFRLDDARTPPRPGETAMPDGVSRISYGHPSAVRTLGMLIVALFLALGSPAAATAQDITVIRPADDRPEQRIDVNGSLIAITHVEDARQADAVFFEGQRDRYQRAGTDPDGRPYGLLLTYDMDGRAAFIVLDFSWLREEERLGFVNLMLHETGASAARAVPGTHESVQLLLHAQADGTYLAREYRELAKGSMVNNTDWGINEAYTTRDDSINARVDNVPDDDEALNQGDRFDQKGRRVDDDDD